MEHLPLAPDGHEDAASSGVSPHGDDEHRCGCDEQASDRYPELDARIVPHAIRHAAILGALDGVGLGDGMVLVAPHDPLPLLAQIEARDPGAFTISYLERGPQAWRLLFLRIQPQPAQAAHTLTG